MSSEAVLEMHNRRERVLSTISPLRYIFWGAILCILDFSFSTKTNGSGFKFDILNDFLGMIFITVGASKLGKIEVTPGYCSSLTFIKVICFIATAKALIDHAIFETPTVWDFFWTIFNLVELYAIVSFCWMMRLLCEVVELEEPRRSWNTTSVLFIVIFAIPLGIFYAAALVAMVTRESFHINLGPYALIAVGIFLIPPIHFFISTSRMLGAAKSIEDDMEQDYAERVNQE